MKRYKIRKRSPLWWAIKTTKYAAAIAGFYIFLIATMGMGQ